MFKRILRPTGNKINLNNAPFDENKFSPFNINFYQSGTAALAATILACKQDNKKAAPEVLLPAYTCPDIISAAIFSGVTPILVDLEANSPNMSLASLKRKITPNTIAIIAINFLGIPENTLELRNICNQNNLILIEDSAQALPDNDFSSYWKGDYIIISFGRGKPLNLLGGGAVLMRPEIQSNDTLTTLKIEKSKIKTSLSYQLKIIVYNLLIHPLIYSLLLKLPGLRIGDTVFKPLTGINSFQAYKLKKLTGNLKKYISTDKSGHVIRKHLMTITNKSIIDLTEKKTSIRNLLRYPILIKDPILHANILKKFSEKGLSNMYGKELNKISGLEKFIDTSEEFPNAKCFSTSLITIPVHNDFHEEDIIQIIKYINHYIPQAL